MFGPHLIIDGSRCDTRKLADRILVEQILNDYPTAIGMTKIGGPYMFEYQAPDPAYSGVSGLVVIAESHIAIHTFPELDYFTLDIFSCKNFDHEKAIAYIKEAFDVQEMDRMLVQRGLSFRGPHHGKHGATDDLIAAADARLAAGIVSNEPALPDEPAETAALMQGRAALAARHADATAPGEHIGGGYMIWPQYGVTPDYGTYGALAEAAFGEPAGLAGPHLVPMRAARAPEAEIEPVLVNPTASISGLLDKLSVSSGAGRAMGSALATWERFARDPACGVALALSTPVVAAGMRELLVYAVERRYIDVLVCSADDLFADCLEAFGYTHQQDGARADAAPEDRAKTREALVALLRELPDGEIGSAADLWRTLGAMLPARAARKGVLQAAAAAGVPIFAPDVASSAFGGVLLAARAQGTTMALGAAEDVLSLARVLARMPHLGVIRVGTGTAGAFLNQAREVLPLLEMPRPALVGAITLDATAGAGSVGEQAITVASDASLALPLLITGLAQRLPAGRLPGAWAQGNELSEAPTAEPALA